MHFLGCKSLDTIAHPAHLFNPKGTAFWTFGRLKKQCKLTSSPEPKGSGLTSMPRAGPWRPQREDKRGPVVLRPLREVPSLGSCVGRRTPCDVPTQRGGCGLQGSRVDLALLAGRGRPCWGGRGMRQPPARGSKFKSPGARKAKSGVRYLGLPSEWDRNPHSLRLLAGSPQLGDNFQALIVF